VFCLTFELAPGAQSVRAQSTSASLAGRITDPSRARIAGASVTAIHTSTSSRYGAPSDASGEYALANLPPGDYRIEIEKPGFRKLVRPDVTLRVQDALEIDFQMAVGVGSETITVKGGAPLVNTESGLVSTVVDRTFADDLPLNGRSFQTLILLTPGVVPTVTAFDDQGQFSVNGQRADANYLTVDGVSANFGVTGYTAMNQSAGGLLPALSASGGTNSLVSVDAMQEFRILTSSFAPEFGRTPGGQISIVTRSGSNDFHGTLFDYFRNSDFDARDWFTNFNGLPKPEERQNDFGGVLGGPVRKNKTFFFFSYEGLRLRQPSAQETSVPDAASRLQAPASIRPYLNAFPMPNGPEVGSGLAQFNAGYSNPSSLDATSLRLDHVVKSKLTLFGRYDYSPSSLDSRGSVLSTTTSLLSSVQTVTIGLTEQFTPAISNELRTNYSNDRIGTTMGLDNFGGAVPLADAQVFPQGLSSANSLLEFYLLGAGEYALGKFGTDEQRQVNFVDNLSVAKAGHRLKFGVDYRRLAPFTSPLAYAQFAEFTGVTNSPGGVLSGTAAFAEVQNYQGSGLRTRNFSFYAQDTWRIAPRLTLTYGLRWDVNPALTGANAASDPYTVTGLNSPASLALAPRGNALYQTTYGNVAPRSGLAYQFSGRQNWGLTLRAGFGIFYDPGQGSLGGVSSYFPYFATRVAQPSPTPFPLSAQNAAPPPLTGAPPVADILVAKPDLKLPRTYQWNVALEQTLGASQSLSVTYIGAVGRDLLRATNLSNPNPNFGFVSVTDNSATSDYNALQVKFDRRMSHGFQALASYTFSHSIDDASTDAADNYLNTPGAFANPNIDRGDSDFDIRHAFTTGLTYQAPSPASGAVVRALLGGWSLNSFILARSAPPVDLVGALFEAYGTALYPRPDVVPGVPTSLYGSGYPGGKIFNKAAFTAAPPGRQGDFGRNVLRGFDATQADLGLQRAFRITEKTALRLRGEFFNILNHPNFGNPTNSLTSPLFGRSTETLANSLGSGGANGGFNPLYQIGGPRSVQLALKLVF
jgi:hypothetical protein